MTKTSKTKYTSPLALYVIWHPEFMEGKFYAEKVFSAFCRDLKNPLGRNSNIPVYFRSKVNKELGVPIDIDYSEADKNAILLLVDEKMFEDNKWEAYIQDLVKNKAKNTRVFPVAFSEYSYHIDKENLNKIQFIRAKDVVGKDEKETNDNRWELIRSRLLHDIARQLLNIQASYDVEEMDDAPVQLFLSHAKKDGEDIAKMFRDHIENNSKLNTFFDTNDIADGHNFEKEITKHLEKSAVIIFNTDEYSNREWCRREVIIAKRFRCPILCVLDIKSGETRSFPYSGNVPTLIWNNNMEEIINQMLIQVITNTYSKQLLEKMISLYDINNCLALPKAPELFNYIDIEELKKDKHYKGELIVLYPEPPIGAEEIKLLNDIDNKIKFITPVLLSTLK
nr:toll/interleukin-1 receptor domain-containing protein [uncultured Flavobacterium sp.]